MWEGMVKSTDGRREKSSCVVPPNNLSRFYRGPGFKVALEAIFRWAKVVRLS